jgi:hypothetical protein
MNPKSVATFCDVSFCGFLVHSVLHNVLLLSAEKRRGMRPVYTHPNTRDGNSEIEGETNRECKPLLLHGSRHRFSRK